ncbi:MAG: type III pantothenate kinase [Candidatus Zixiibacteriota bacterium]|nr:MAG: type III pantothenate kinase [candidate division Zixibacteria bacterium]
MLLAIDVGNTNTVVGVFRGETLKDHFRVASNRSLTADEAGFFVTGLLERMQVPNEEIDTVVIGSVVPPLTSVFETTAKKYFGCLPVVVSAHIALPLEIKVDKPEEVGADRICNAVAAKHKFGGEVIVVDFGTATTFDVIDADGAYIGGVITPGPETSMKELVRRAARLFEVRIEPPMGGIIGKTTAGALKSGLFYGTLGQVDYLIERIIAAADFTRPKVIATGGLADGIEKHSRFIKLLEPTLTLEGLRLIGESQ